MTSSSPLPRPDLAGVKAIVFDTFGSVVDWRGSLIADLGGWAAERGIGAADWAGLVDAWRAAYAPSMDRVRKGELPWTILDALHEQLNGLEVPLQTVARHEHQHALGRRVRQILVERVEFGITGPGGVKLGDAVLDHINRGWHRLKPWPDAVPGLTRLRRRYIIGPLSNGNVALLVNMAKAAGIPWDMICSTELFGHYKPDPETYLGTARILGLEPGEVMMAAAHNGDLAAARACGLRTAFWPRVIEYGPLQKRDFAADSDWDIVASDIEDMATQLGL